MDTHIMKRIFFGMFFLNILLFFLVSQQAEAQQPSTFARAQFTITLTVKEKIPTTAQEVHRAKGRYEVLREYRIAPNGNITNFLLISAK